MSLQLPNEESWVFEAGDVALDIEESIFFAGVEGPRRTEQIVVHAHTKDLQAVAWSLTRADEPQDPEGSATAVSAAQQA